MITAVMAMLEACTYVLHDALVAQGGETAVRLIWRMDNSTIFTLTIDIFTGRLAQCVELGSRSYSAVFQDV